MLWWYACAFSHRIPPKNRGGAYRRQRRSTWFGTSFGSFFQWFFFQWLVGQVTSFSRKKTKKLSANACAGNLLLCWSRDWLLFERFWSGNNTSLLFVFSPVDSLLKTKLLALLFRRPAQEWGGGWRGFEGKSEKERLLLIWGAAVPPTDTCFDTKRQTQTTTQFVFVLVWHTPWSF